MTTTTVSEEADRALKSAHRAMWGLGDYPTLAAEVIPALGPVLVEACGIRPGDRVLDVAAGAGNASVPAARAGASVVASDLSPALMDAGRARTGGLDIQWREADAEALPFGDGEFDAVMSCVGVMFAPHHQISADELVRVCRPGGTIGLLSWTPQGFIGQMFAAMKPYAAPPAPGASPPPLWGDETHVRELLGDRVTDVVAVRQSLAVDAFADAESFRDYFKQRYGPTIATYRRIADDPDKVAALDEALADLGRRHTDASGVMPWEYLLLTARRAG